MVFILLFSFSLGWVRKGERGSGSEGDEGESYWEVGMVVMETETRGGSEEKVGTNENEKTDRQWWIPAAANMKWGAWEIMGLGIRV